MKSPKQINALFRTRIQSYIRHHEKEVNSFAKIPWGYGMRATHRLKHFSDKSTEIRSALEDMVKHYTIDEKLLKDAVQKQILTASFINEHQKITHPL